VAEVSVTVRFGRRVDAMMAQGVGLLRKFRQPLKGTIFRIPTLAFVAASMRRRMDAILLPGKLGAHKIRQLLGNSSRHRALTVVVAGLIGLALILLLLEISVRRQLANEASDAALDTVSALSARPQKMDFGDAFSIQRTGSISLQSADLSAVPRATPSSDDVQTLGQAFREPVPLPRPRKPR
jgi:hypothetical protein